MTVMEKILVFGENPNDCRAVRALVRGLRPDLDGRASVEVRRSPMTLVKGLSAARGRAQAKEVVATARAEDAKRATTVRACVLHRDTDAVEPSSAAHAAEILAAYVGCPGVVVPAVAAWEIEAWWYLFPVAIAAARSSWQAPTRHVGGDTGRIESPKEKLKKDVRPAGQSSRIRFTTYEESDSEAIALKVVEGGHLHSPSGTSTSWTAFVAAAKTI